MAIAITFIVSIIMIGWYLLDLKNHKLDTKMIVMIALFSSISFILSLIQFIKFPQGGGITLFSMLPIMLLSILYGRTGGVTGGLVFGLLKLLNGPTIVHPVQFLLDYLLSTMALGLAGQFGSQKKLNIVFGCLLATILSVLVNIISGCVFFGQYAPEKMNVILYSCIYNISSLGVEGLLSTCLISILPIKRFTKAADTCSN